MVTPARPVAAPRTPRPVPTDDVERELARSLGGDAVVVGLDEVGRGALAGPVVVGACAVRIEQGRLVRPLPDGVRDSKALTARRREALVEPIRDAALSSGLGWASAAEVDLHGIMGALSLAAVRAVDDLGIQVDAILLDGDVDVIGTRLLAAEDGRVPAVTLRVGADRDCVSVAAASVLAKVARDAHMVELARDAPDYAWESNKGYGAAAHRAALARIGAHTEHRRTWNLGTVAAVTQPPAVVRSVGTPVPGADVLWTDEEIGRRDRNDDGQQEVHR